MRLRVAAIIVALVVVPGIVFAGAEASSSPKQIVSPGTAYLAEASVESNGTLNDNVALWLSKHPGGGCDVQRQAAICGDGDSNQEVVILAGNDSR